MKKTQATLVANLKMLLALKGWSPRQLAKESGVAHRTIAYILAGDSVPSIETADALGRAFGLNGWLMIHPSLTADLERFNDLESLLEMLMKADKQDLKLLKGIAERLPGK